MRCSNPEVQGVEDLVGPRGRTALVYTSRSAVYLAVLVPSKTADDQPAVGALGRVWLANEGHVLSGAKAGKASEPLSTLVDGYGYWSMNLPVAACDDLTLKLQAIGRRGSEAELIQSASEIRPAPTVMLSEEGPISIYLPLITR